MNMVHRGFTLLELAIAIAFSSLLAITLYLIFMQTNSTVGIISVKSSHDLMVSTLSHQLEKDLYGAAVPIQFLIERKEKEEAEKKKKQQKEKKEEQQENGDQQKKEGEQEKKEKKIPPIKKVFYAAEQKNQLKQLTFITHDALAFYSDKEQQDVTPLFVRVFYMLKEDPQNAGLYTLLRQQGVSLDPGAYGDEKKTHAYELARDIKKMKVTFFKEIIEKKDEEKHQQDKKEKAEAAKDKKEKQPPKKYAKVTSWSTDEMKDDEPILPSFVEVEITFDVAGAEEEERLIFEIAVSDSKALQEMIPKEKPQTKGPQEKEAKAKDEAARAKTQADAQKRRSETAVIQRINPQQKNPEQQKNPPQKRPSMPPGMRRTSGQQVGKK